MSESRYFNSEMDRFIAGHPTSDGWKTYTCYQELGGRLYLHFLLDFIRDRHPTILKRRVAPNEIRTDDMLGEKGDFHVLEAGSAWDRQKELDANNWTGDIEVEWQGEPIHYRDFVYFDGMARCSVTLIAVKSNLALRHFHRALDEYGSERDKKGEPHIMVVNGEDIPIAPVEWPDVLLADGQAEDIRANVDGFFHSREKYKELGIPYRRGFLFAGAPGCGKTMTLKALARSTKATFIAVHARAGIKEAQIEQAFYLASKHSPAVVIFEDIDRLMRSGGVSISHFLNLLDGLKVLDGVLVIATANRPEKLDQALLHRPSRFDRVWRFRLPDVSQRLALLRRKGGRYFSEGILKKIAEQADGFSMAYVQEIVINALLECAHSGQQPGDTHVRKSFETLKKQRKGASRPDEDLAEKEALGFLANRTPSEYSAMEELEELSCGNDGN